MAGFVFVSTVGSTISRKDNNILIENANGKVKIPIGAIEHMFVFGGINITTPALSFLSTHGKCVFFLSQFGDLKGILTPDPMPSNYSVRIAQYRIMEDENEKLKLIEMLLKNKAKGVGSVMSLDDTVHVRTSFIRSFLKMIKFRDIKSALGVDGNLNKSLFEFLKDKFLPDEFEFDSRRYHPAKDPVNALLSLTYSIYYSILIPMSISMGFDPYIGFFHTKRGKHASFCSDIIEVSRPWLTLFVFKLLSDGFFYPSDFEIKGDRCYLKPKALKAFLKIFTEKVLHIGSPYTSYSEDFLKKIKGELLK